MVVDKMSEFTKIQNSKKCNTFQNNDRLQPLNQYNISYSMRQY